MNLETIFKQNEKCPVRPLDDGLIIMSPTGDTTHSLEDLGVFIWNLLDGERKLQYVLENILEEYDVPEDSARTDLLQLITQMQESDLIFEI